MTVDRESLTVRQASKGDRRAFERLYREHVGRVYGLCLRMTREPAEAEDCVQEAFIQAWRRLGQFRGDARFATWMHRIAVNAVLARRRRLRPEYPLEQAPEAGSAPDNPSMARDLEAAIGALPDGARDVFVLHEVYGYTHEETGEMLGIAGGTCKAQLHRARKLLRGHLGEADQEREVKR